MARRRTNVIRPYGQASWRRKTKPEPGSGVSHQPPAGGRAVVMPAKARLLSMWWLTTGRWDGAVCGLGTLARVSIWMMSRAGGRGVIVPRKSVKADGGKGARESEPGVQVW
jgi:hypothetical protein